MKKIYILIPWFHPAYKAGGPIQSIANMIRELWQEDISFSIFCSDQDLDGTKLDIPADEWVQENDKTRIWYSSSITILPVLKKEIREQRPDHLFIVGLYDWNYNFKLLLFAKGVNKIISVRGMLHPEALAQKPFKKKVYLSLWKLLGCHKKHLFHATDDVEAGYIKKVFGSSARVAVAGNFPMLYEQLPIPVKEKGKLKLVSVALISPMKNYLLVLEALRAVGNEKGASIEYTIYGPIKDREDRKSVV